MAEVLNELGLVDTDGPKHKPDPNWPQPDPGNCTDGRSFGPGEAEHIRQRLGFPEGWART